MARIQHSATVDDQRRWVLSTELAQQLRAGQIIGVVTTSVRGVLAALAPEAFIGKLSALGAREPALLPPGARQARP